MARLSETSQAVTFLMALFASTSERPVYLSSLPNIRNDPQEAPERRLTTRDPASIDAFIHKYDRPRRAMYFCVSTINGQTRNKDNAVETVCLHADIDFKSVVEDEPTIRERLAQLRYPPSIIVRSGNGLHCYWLLKEGIDTQLHRDRIEAALRQLADLVAGDLSVCEVSRLMRVPGSHNSKGTSEKAVVFIPVVLEPIVGDVRRYELDDLEEWLSETAPVCQRKPADVFSTAVQRSPGNGSTAQPTNPYLAYAQRAGYQPPLDVEEALAAMTIGNIHSTQLSVTASMLNAGNEIADVVARVIEATADAAGDYGTRWNWTRERKAVWAMCETWLAKHPREVKQTSTEDERTENATGTDGQAENVVDLNAARKKKAKPEKAPRAASSTHHIALAEAVLEVIHARGERMIFTRRDGAHLYTDRLWHLETNGSITAWLDYELQVGAIALKMDPNDKLIREARNYIVRDKLRSTPAWDGHGQIPTLSGLVHPRTGFVTPPDPEHFATWRIDAVYDPAEACPLWLQMLEDAFADRDVGSRALHVQLLQEMLGAGLIDTGKPKELSQALVIHGGSDTGKSGIVHVMAGLFGVSHSTPLDVLDKAHGLMPFAYRRPWAVHEAFDQGRWLLSSVAKALISGEPIQINIKGGPQIERVFTAPIFWATNAPPQFKEATKAIVNRIAVIETKREFDSVRKTGVAALAAAQGYGKPSDLVLATELPGLLAWAVAGLRSVLERGYFVRPAESVAAADAIRRDSNLAEGFIADCCSYDPDYRIAVPDFSVAHSSWWLENKGTDSRLPSSDSIGRNIRALNDPRIITERDMHRRYYCGLKFNAEGMRHWHNAVVSEAFVFAGKKASTTAADHDPCEVLPGAWSVRASVMSMRMSHRSVSDGDVSLDVSSTQPPDPKP